MSFNVLVASSFEKELKKLSKKYPSIKRDLQSLIEHLAEHPFTGKSIGKDCYKIRIAISSKVRAEVQG